MNVTTLIVNEHRQIGLELDELLDACALGNPALVDELRERLVTTIETHVEVEEEVLLPAATRLGVAYAAVERACEQHRALATLAARLGEVESSGEVAVGARALGEALDAHARHAERALLDPLRRACGDGLVPLAATYASVRRNVAEDRSLAALLAFTLRADACCVDVGCHEGAVLREIVRCAPRGRHVAYEPIPALAERLRRRFPGVEVREAAASDRDGSSTFAHVTSAAGYSGLRALERSPRGWPGHVRDADVRELVVATERLDAGLPDGFAPDLVKIDVEGAEALVIAGALGTLRRHRPVVVFEHMGRSDAYATGSEDVWDLLVRDAELRIYDLRGRGPYSRAEFTAAAAELRSTNYVARP